ncbi:hypothetical protein [Paraliomyxa miuraensis]|uniref:hypothetical protein n=1 Tax=Paraliomyxa miuraensis TaxID=376150 RepID=UPI00225AFF2F|nr:hypothetical protein [Paraliomyxa miuraensis]MCX4242179.1 hypothetical protein [Paraliomyxa miuraensis]
MIRLEDHERQRRLVEFGRLHHRMVWEEMKRNPDLVPGLREHFEVAPELRQV